MNGTELNNATAPRSVDQQQACSAARLFDPRLLDRCLMSKEAAAVFRDEAMRCVRHDELTGAQVVAYLHPDGRVLIDSISPPNDQGLRPLEEEL